MKWKDYLIPDEIQSAQAAASDMLAVATKTSHFWFKQLFAMLLPICLGALCGWLLVNYAGTSEPKDGGIFKDIVIAAMTLASVLAGFMVTLMLFTGRTSGASEVSVDDTQDYIAKICYLLFSQALTLIIHVCSVVFGLAWLALFSVSAATIITDIIFCVTLGFMCLSLARTLLLPFQIYEVHHFELKAMADAKNAAFMKSLESAVVERDL